MRSNNNRWAIPAGLLFLMSIATNASAQTGAVTDGTPLIGAPYKIGGATQVPADPAAYDEVGYATTFEVGSEAGQTANGEAFVATTISAAHRTLPLPSYVEVTALDTGRTILARINDRGPMRTDRIIALSPGAMDQLGSAGDAVAVRVRRVNPPEQERSVLRAGGRAAARLDTPLALLKPLRAKLPDRPLAARTPKAPTEPKRPAASVPAAPPVAPRPAPKAATRPGADFDPAPSAVPSQRGAQSVVATGGYVVQIGAFSARERAIAVARATGANVVEANGLWRVRLGPYPSAEAAQAGQRAAAAKGFDNGRIMANDAR